MNQPDSWNPEQYKKFQLERDAPAFDLMEQISPDRLNRAIDLGCGTGNLTSILHRRFGCQQTLGIDQSARMLAKAHDFQTESLRFQIGDINSFDSHGDYDLIFSNAALQWCPDHASILPRLYQALSPLGQLAIQMPANHDSATHTIAHQVASEGDFRIALHGTDRKTNVETPEWYAERIYSAGFREQRVLLRVYPHVLQSRDEVIEWVKGTLLTYYESRLTPELYSRFLIEYRQRLFEVLPEKKPFLYLFKRLFLWGRK